MSEQRTNRRLAAILAADVVGYSKMMAADEAGTLAALQSHREVLFDPTVERHQGRVVKLMGDGTLVEFSSVVDAVKCALEIQIRAAEQESADSAITLRIGVNLGDVIIECRELTKTFHDGHRELQVLQGIDLSVRAGEVLAISGPSGVGKSTLLHILGTLDRPTDGAVLFRGEPLNTLSRAKVNKVRNEDIGFVFQFYHLLGEFLQKLKKQFDFLFL